MHSFQFYIFKPLMRLARWMQGIFPLQNENSIIRFRKFADMLANFFIHPPRDMILRKDTIAGVSGDWLIPMDALEDPVILFFHGGGLIFGLNNPIRREVAYIARFSGLPAFGVDFSLAPEYPYPVAHDECYKVYQSILQAGKQIVLIGESSGAVLAISTMLRAKKAQISQPLLCVLISPVIDLGFSESDLWQFEDAFAHPNFAYGLHKHYIAENDPSNPELCPINADLSNIAPLFVVAGMNEILRGEADRLSKATEQHKVPMDTKFFPDVWHSWHALVPQLPEATHVLQTIGSEIRLRILH